MQFSSFLPWPTRRRRGTAYGRRLAAAAVAAVLSLGIPGFASAETLNVATHLPGRLPAVQSLVRLAEEVADKTGGRLTLKVFPDGSLANRSQLFSEVQSGNVDLALVPVTAVPGSELFSLPFAVSGNEQIRSIFKSDWGQSRLGGLVFLDSWYFGNTYLYSSSTDLAARDNLAGLKILSTSEGRTRFANWIGATPVRLAYAEVYIALQTGVASAAQLASFDDTVAKFGGGYLLKSNHLVHAHLLLANRAAYERLPRDQRTILQDAAQSIGHDQDLALYEREMGILRNFAESGGRVIEESVPDLRELIAPKLKEELGRIPNGAFILSSANNGCASTAECKCKSGSDYCMCSTKCKDDNNCK